MKITEMKDKSLEELGKMEEELKSQLFKLNLQKSLGQLQNPMKIRGARRDIARIKTLIRERGEKQ
ncbi:MAG TPA: 50S ribosomal protein L29 [Candidatus Aminicenantes bacterium]|nr:50S ribosomal protein L29 [Candidatus Aminicenantes bacterium]HPT00442.1 50S ribosomal protein L29 [Candidatus Aminicenantes bacterium]